MKGYEFIEMLQAHFAATGHAGKDIVFVTEGGGYVPLDIETDGDEVLVLLLEEGK